MAENGFWWVNIDEDIELPQCDVSFNDKGNLSITTRPGTPKDQLDKVMVKQGGAKAFQVQIDKSCCLQATFRQCILRDSKSQPGPVPGITVAAGNLDDGITPAMKFTFTYETG